MYLHFRTLHRYQGGAQTYAGAEKMALSLTTFRDTRGLSRREERHCGLLSMYCSKPLV